jgi:hypothetical protein
MAQAQAANYAAAMERANGNALTAQVGGQALYNNYATARNDLSNYYGVGQIGSQF